LSLTLKIISILRAKIESTQTATQKESTLSPASKLLLFQLKKLKMHLSDEKWIWLT